MNGIGGKLLRPNEQFGSPARGRYNAVAAWATRPGRWPAEIDPTATYPPSRFLTSTCSGFPSHALLPCPLAIRADRSAVCRFVRPGRAAPRETGRRSAARTARLCRRIRACCRSGPRRVRRSSGKRREPDAVTPAWPMAGNRIYTLGDAPSTADDKDEYLLAFDRQSGKQLWKLKTGKPWTDGSPDWQSSRSTPTVDGDRVYVVTPHGELVCADAASGREIWRKDLKDDLDGKKGDGWGYSESVLIDGDRLICTPGGDQATMVALDKKTGEPIWKAARPGDRGAGHASDRDLRRPGRPRSMFRRPPAGPWASGPPTASCSGRKKSIPRLASFPRRSFAAIWCSSPPATSRGGAAPQADRRARRRSRRSKRFIRSIRAWPTSMAGSCSSATTCSAIRTMRAFPSAPT